MTDANSTIFRSEALEYRLQHRRRLHAKVIYPRLMSGRVVFTLWVLLGLLGLGGAASCFITVPAFATGLAIVVESPANHQGSLQVAVLVPAEFEHRVRRGQITSIFTASAGHEIQGSVASVEPGPLDSATLERRLGMPASTFPSPAASVVLIWITVEPNAAITAGDVGQAEIAIGSQQAGAYVPLIGRLFGNEG
ncbi:MAG: hypothetical protein AB7V46_05785 [Thermomicrobiales bacterium]